MLCLLCLLFVYYVAAAYQPNQLIELSHNTTWAGDYGQVAIRQEKSNASGEELFVSVPCALSGKTMQWNVTNLPQYKQRMEKHHHHHGEKDTFVITIPLEIQLYLTATIDPQAPIQIFYEASRHTMDVVNYWGKKK